MKNQIFKKNYISILSFLLFVSCSIDKKESELILASIFSDSLVLQQMYDTALWGKSKPNEIITVKGSWGKEASTQSNEKGDWELKLSTPKAGGPYTITIQTSNNSILLKDVMIGEVWLSSGQSNMEWKMNQCVNCIDNQDEEISKVNNNEIRMFTVPMDLSGELIKKSKWLVANPENAEGFSAAAYYFARKLNKELKIPIGIVNTSWGGTRVEAWTSNRKLMSISSTKDKVPEEQDYDLLQIEFKRLNDSIKLAVQNKFGFKTFEIPEWTEDETLWEFYEKGWSNFDIEDKEFREVNFDDSNWSQWESKYTDYGNINYQSEGRFESAFEESNKLLSDGVIWFRTKIIIDDISEDYQLVVEKGIDDTDQTYFNGELIGNTFSWSRKRSYNIPKELLKKGENILAIRITDRIGGGGFNSHVIIKNSKIKKQLVFSEFKFKHHAFIINASSVLIHNLSHEELIKKSSYLLDNIPMLYRINDPNGYSALFKKMLTPVMPYSIKGAIWYQGESNVDNNYEYQELFTGMIEDWRENWGYDFSFYYAQIAPFKYGVFQESHKLREAQRKTLKTTNKTGMVIIMDIGEEGDIHPHNKQDVGKRLALLALDKDYEYDIISSGPLYKSHEIFKNYIDIDFENKGSGLQSNGILKDFEIAEDNMVYQKAKAEIIDNKVRVSSSMIKYPKHVRYGWKNWTVGTLFNKEGLPASSFNSID
ncbi:sialate O-acetylesterase [Flavobacteriaceae bacterium]|nr:sialate O-acetylesterase [Flavobacteriaceae bacterium]